MNACRIFFISIISLTSLTLNATEQSPDILICKSDTIYIESYPLAALMDSDSLIHQRIFGYSETTCLSSDCWRGHIATWTIENDSLFLIDLISGCGNHHFKLEDVFSKSKVINEKVFADWFTGELLEYQSWFSIAFEENSKDRAARFSCELESGIVSNSIQAEITDPTGLGNETAIYIKVDKSPVLLSSNKKYEIPELLHFIKENLRYPHTEVHCVGRVFISFVVEEKGSISNIKLLNKLCEGYDEEAMRVVVLMAHWKPGEIKGKAVRTRLTVPISFRLE